MDNLVFIDEHDLLGSNYYWRKRDNYHLAEEELKAAGLPNERLRVHSTIIGPLQRVDRHLQTQGYRLYVSEGYRPAVLGV